MAPPLQHTAVAPLPPCAVQFAVPVQHRPHTRRTAVHRVCCSPGPVDSKLRTAEGQDAGRPQGRRSARTFAVESSASCVDPQCSHPPGSLLAHNSGLPFSNILNSFVGCNLGPMSALHSVVVSVGKSMHSVSLHAAYKAFSVPLYLNERHLLSLHGECP